MASTLTLSVQLGPAAEAVAGGAELPRAVRPRAKCFRPGRVLHVEPGRSPVQGPLRMVYNTPRAAAGASSDRFSNVSDRALWFYSDDTIFCLVFTDLRQPMLCNIHFSTTVLVPAL